jgi:hypothetical protein
VTRKIYFSRSDSFDLHMTHYSVRRGFWDVGHLQSDLALRCEREGVEPARLCAHFHVVCRYELQSEDLLEALVSIGKNSKEKVQCGKLKFALWWRRALSARVHLPVRDRLITRT